MCTCRPHHQGHLTGYCASAAVAPASHRLHRPRSLLEAPPTRRKPLRQGPASTRQGAGPRRPCGWEVHGKTQPVELGGSEREKGRRQGQGQAEGMATPQALGWGGMDGHKPSNVRKEGGWGTQGPQRGDGRGRRRARMPKRRRGSDSGMNANSTNARVVGGGGGENWNYSNEGTDGVGGSSPSSTRCSGQWGKEAGKTFREEMHAL